MSASALRPSSLRGAVPLLISSLAYAVFTAAYVVANSSAPQPSTSGSDVLRYVLDHGTAIDLGAFLLVIAAVVIVPIAEFLARLVRRPSPVGYWPPRRWPPAPRSPGPSVGFRSSHPQLCPAPWQTCPSSPAVSDTRWPSRSSRRAPAWQSAGTGCCRAPVPRPGWSSPPPDSPPPSCSWSSDSAICCPSSASAVLPGCCGSHSNWPARAGSACPSPPFRPGESPQATDPDSENTGQPG